VTGGPKLDRLAYVSPESAVQTLAAKIATLQVRRGELVALLDAEQELTITEAHLEQLRRHVTDTIEHGDPDAAR
jgi:hypothetical protein